MSTAQDWRPTSAEALSPGITLLEASAGTGKTYNITSLILRLVAEKQLKMGEILVVTFTRAATAELRERIRGRLGEAVIALERALDGTATSHPSPTDEVLAHLLVGEESVLRLRLRRLRLALESFDQALISTIHGFCQRMLQEHAFEARTDFELELLADTSGVIEEMVDDWLSRELHPNDPDRYQYLVNHCDFDRTRLQALAKLAVQDPEVEVLPARGPDPRHAWTAEAEAFASRWQGGWRESLGATIEQAKSSGVFKPRQRTYGGKKLEERLEQVNTWVQRGAPFCSLPEDAKYWSEAELTRQLDEGRSPPTHPAMDALARFEELSRLAVASERADFARWARVELDRRLEGRRAQSFSDLMRQLARVLRNEGAPGRQALLEAIGERFRAALIDEFQDTDREQWDIFRILFGSPRRWLYLIGDPKQAIYGFRGANVQVYLHAKRSAGGRIFTMRRNFRSDQRLLDAFNHLMDREGFFAEAGIDYVPVDAPPHLQLDRLRPADAGAPPSAPLELRFFDNGLTGDEATPEEPITRGLAGTFLCQRVAEDLVELLESGTTYRAQGHSDSREGCRPLRPGDIAVLVRTSQQARQIQMSLTQAGVPAVLHGQDSVLASEEASDLQRWLGALDAPGRDRAARAAAVSHLFGRTGTLLSGVDEEQPEAVRLWDEWLGRLNRWRRRYETHGFLGTLRLALAEDLLPKPDGDGFEDATTRLLRRTDGERRVTNLWHVAELLHNAETTERLGLGGLLAWLKRERAEATIDPETAELRLERDDDAVTVMTLHKSKGLEFGVVFVPYFWTDRAPNEDEPLLIPSPADPSLRVLDLRHRTDRSSSFQRAKRDHAQENLRLFYVGVTRARLRCILYTGHVKDLAQTVTAPVFHAGPLQPGLDRLIEGPRRVMAADGASLWEDLQELSQSSKTRLPDGTPTISLFRCAAPTGRVWKAPPPPTLALRAREFLRTGLDRSWRRHSYTALSGYAKRASAAHPLAEEREGGGRDEPMGSPEATVQEPPPRNTTELQLPLAEALGGTRGGIFFHAVLEHTDFRWGQPEHPEGLEQLRTVVSQQLARHAPSAAVAPGVLEQLTEGLRLVLRTPLGGPLGETCLSDIPKSSRLDELRFDLPIAGGSRFGKEGFVEALPGGQLVEALRLRSDEELSGEEAPMTRSYLDQLHLGAELAGFLTGSIDLVFRHPVGGHPRWFLVDYKSNRLWQDRTRPPSAADFHPTLLRREMEREHYYLQYHLYLVALHRYLKVRLGSAYDYERDFGGVYYLFLRGMLGTATPSVGHLRHASFHDRPPWTVLEALDRAFDGPLVPSDGALS